MRNLVAEFKSHAPASRLLMVNQFGINVGFYMLMPYLATYLSGPLALGGVTVGLILGVRNFSQQGMFFVGGTLADRFGYKRLIVAGCTTRTVGFALLAVAESVPTLLIAAAATGFAGAMFNPAVRAYLANDAGDRRVEAFAVFNVFYQAGILAGPLVGIILTTVDFQLASGVAAIVFAGLTILQVLHLPSPHRDVSSESRVGVAREWRTVLTNRAFMLFALAMTGTYTLSFQVYLALPIQAQRITATPGEATRLVTAMFVASGVLAVAGQLRLTAWLKARWRSSQCLVIGSGTLAASFLPVAFLPDSTGRGTSAAAAAALLVCGVTIAVGTVTAFPFEMDTITRLCGDRLVATHYGFYNTVIGVGVLIANVFTGSLFELADRAAVPSMPWVTLAVVGCVSAVALFGLSRTHLRAPESLAELRE